MKVGSVNDQLGQAVACVIVENDEEIDGEFFRLLDHWGQSWTEGVVSILGPSTSQFTEEISTDFTNHLQNYATKENKWITSSVPIKKQLASEAFCLQIISKDHCSRDIQNQIESLVEFQGNATGRIFKKHTNALIIIDKGN